MSITIFNNLSINSLSIAFVSNAMKSIPLSKAFLILPIVRHKEFLTYIARKNVKIKSLENAIIERTSDFSNFNKRYYDSLEHSLHAIQFLSDIEVVSICDGYINSNIEIPYKKSMGKRADQLYRASDNISTMLSGNIETMYLNLRVEL